MWVFKWVKHKHAFKLSQREVHASAFLRYDGNVKEDQLQAKKTNVRKC